MPRLGVQGVLKAAAVAACALLTPANGRALLSSPSQFTPSPPVQDLPIGTPGAATLIRAPWLTDYDPDVRVPPAHRGVAAHWLPARLAAASLRSLALKLGLVPSN